MGETGLTLMHMTVNLSPRRSSCGVFRQPEVTLRFASEDVFKQAGKWIDVCSEKHKGYCSSERTTRLLKNASSDVTSLSNSLILVSHVLVEMHIQMKRSPDKCDILEDDYSFPVTILYNLVSRRYS